jgi:ubiquinone/menaquinone biosynthesis C-methylase UbiE
MSQQQKVVEQFGPRAQAYLGSAVHAQGLDLQQLTQLAGVLATNTPLRVLDIGCGAGHASFAVAPHAAEIIAYDLSEAMLQVVRQTAESRQLPQLRTCQGAAEQLPFEADRFDLVISRFSAHHWLDPRAALREVVRVLRPGGQLCLIDIIGPQGRHASLLDTHLQAVELLRDPSHVRDYSPAQWLAMLAEADLLTETWQAWRLPMEFASWVARMQTPAPRVELIRQLWSQAPQEVRDYFAVDAQANFQLEAGLFRATRR